VVLGAKAVGDVSRRRPGNQEFGMKNRFMAAVAVAAIMTATGVAHAQTADVAQLKQEAAALKKQNEALELRLNKLEKQQAQAPAAAPAGDFLAQAAAAPGTLLTGEAPLTFYGITLYGSIDAGLGWQSAGAQFNGSLPQNVAPLVSKQSNHSTFTGIQGGGLGGYNVVGLKGDQSLGVADIRGVFDLSTNFSPLSGQLSNGPNSLQQNAGVLLPYQSANGDSSRAGQAFNNVAYAGLKSDTYGALTFGRQNALTAETLKGFDPFNGSLAFSATGYSGTWAGGGFTEGTKWDDSLRYVYTYNKLLFIGGQVKLSQWGNPQSGGNGNYQITAGVLDWNGLSASVSGGHVSGVPVLTALSQTSGTLGGATATIPGTAAGVLANSLNVRLADQDLITAGVKYKYQQFTFFGGYQYFRNTNPSTTQPSSTPASAPTSVSSSYLWNDNNGYQASSLTSNYYGSASVNNIFWIGGKYSWDPKLDFIAAYYHWTQNQFNTFSAVIPNGAAPTSVACNNARLLVTYNKFGVATATSAPRPSNCSGTSDAVSLAATYQFTKRLSGYAGILASSVSGGIASGYQVTSVWSPSVGLRYNF
jgi:predicted porin